MPSSPIRALREEIASSLTPLGVEVHDVLPDHISPPAIAVGLATIARSRINSAIGFVLSVEVTLVGERADFHDAQFRIDDLEWQAWTALNNGKRWGLQAEPRSVTVAGQDYPGVIFVIESTSPC